MRDLCWLDTLLGTLLLVSVGAVALNPDGLPNRRTRTLLLRVARLLRPWRPLWARVIELLAALRPRAGRRGNRTVPIRPLVLPGQKSEPGEAWRKGQPETRSHGGSAEPGFARLPQQEKQEDQKGEGREEEDRRERPANPDN